ncbi:MAG TPA: heat-inducible transcription repressor HrcA [Nitrospinae bacterium]|nr:heat-inducible transcription repressor HrcA [Nitrospinota bacterium]
MLTGAIPLFIMGFGMADHNSDLSTRNQEVLRAVVNTFIETGDPVGSRTLSKKIPTHLSPATIRNIMGDLAEAGFLTKPHASAGRLPTDLGYRVFVDDLMNVHEVTPEEQESIRRSYANRIVQLEQVVTQASRILSKLTHQAGIVLLPGKDQLFFRHIQFIRMSTENVLVVIVSKSGVVQNRVVPIEEDLNQEELDRISRFLNDEYGGLSLREVRSRILKRMGEERDHLDMLYRRAEELSRRAFLGDEDDVGDTLFVEGASRVFTHPDFAGDFEKLQTLYAAFEEKGKLISLLDGFLDSPDVTVLIGAENDIDGMSDCSVVARSYFLGTRPLGTIGIIGPKRMRYDRMVSLVEWTAAAVSHYISHGDTGIDPK